MVYQTNTAAVLYQVRDLRMEERPIETPGSGEVLINIRATGICGSDLHYYLDGTMGPLKLDPRSPMILGHESSGIVTQLGPGVTGLEIGDRVAIEPGRACQECRYCKEQGGQLYNLCPKMKFLGSLRQGPNDGSLRRYACFPAYLCHKIPGSMSFEDGALIEPLAVAVHAVNRTHVKQGSVVAVFGAGPVGLMTAAAAYAQGASQCLILDINPSRLEFAKKYLPAVQTMAMPKVSSTLEEDEAQQQSANIQKAFPKFQDVDVVFECTGVETCVNIAMYLTRPGGAVMLIGIGKRATVMPIDIIVSRQINILGNFRYANTYAKAIELVKDGKIPLDGLVTHRFALEDTLQAFELAMKNSEGVIKIQIGDF
ncbi:sorbitol dehydrogenase-like protein [Zychaea mexicana]|uniref:sorbitol dehydrogenase-like protein n=1 Tax=Zychaea mexicana TaxID=64656 RepID=UPI0022FEF576|nr:sorbitol dehydrogenase-like protein [Zychaea mexicana]KAI9488987.1 sorbitol dehydrogenase-like protein [Zychaea mexicana]